MTKARATLHKLGGATHAPHWAKFWMAVIGVCKYDIVNPAPPELWLLPDWVPIAPWRWWIHIRQVFLCMSYISSKKWSCEEDDLIRSLRNEVFVEPWESIDWNANRNSICPKDNYHPKSWLLNTANWLLVNVWNPILRPNALKNKAEGWVSDLIDMEMANTDFACLAPVNQPMSLVCCYIRDGPDSYTVRRLRDRMEDGLFVNSDGMMTCGTNGVQSWDTAFAIQAVVSAGLGNDPRWRPMMNKALEFLDNQQIREEVKDMDKCYRHPRKGAWAFSTKVQGYAVSDCVSEALKSVILLQKEEPGYPQRLDDRRIFDAVDTLLTYQDPKTGGCASYERPRGGEWMEMLNAAEIFGNIMVEYLYPECTTAAVTTLSLFQKHWPEYRAKEVSTFIERAVRWIKTAQYDHGGWYGSWAICFTYATMFGLESLATIGETYENSESSKRGCEFLISKQREDGGWSEHYEVCHYFVSPLIPQSQTSNLLTYDLIAVMRNNALRRAPQRQPGGHDGVGAHRADAGQVSRRGTAQERRGVHRGAAAARRRVEAGGGRGRVQQELLHRVPQLQVHVHDQGPGHVCQALSGRQALEV